MTKRIAITIAALVVGAFALAACGSSNSSTSTDTAATTTSTADTTKTTGGTGGSGGAGGTLEIAADPSGALAYTTGDLSVDAGTVTVDFTNDASLGHNVEIEDSSGGDVGGTDTISGSSTSTTVDLQPGTYTYYCSVDGHQAAGMEGTITVK